MKVLVTGCAGLLGANYSRHLIKNGHTVIGVDNFSGGYKAFLPKSDGFIFYKTNIENKKKYLISFRKKIQMSYFILLLTQRRDYLLL